MVMPEDVRAIFQDARTLQSSAVDQLDQGDIRDAAEKAWGSTLRAADALVLARTGELMRIDGCLIRARSARTPRPEELPSRNSFLLAALPNQRRN